MEYNPTTEIFSQWLAGNGGYGMLQDEATVVLGSEATYEVDGEPFEPYVGVDYDVNQDGRTNSADAQAVLDYVSGKNDGSTYDLDKADGSHNHTTHQYSMGTASVSTGSKSVMTINLNRLIQIAVRQYFMEQKGTMLESAKPLVKGSYDKEAVYACIRKAITEETERVHKYQIAFNEIIKDFDKKYNADSAKGYEPLTSDEKYAMSDKEVEDWENKIKGSLLLDRINALPKKEQDRIFAVVEALIEHAE